MTDPLVPDDGCLDVPPGGWHAAVRRARDQGLTFFDWLGAVDESSPPGEEPSAPDESSAEPVRFHVVAHLWSVADRRGLLLRTGLPESAPALPSIVDLFVGAAWYERETFEMFGIDFVGHPNLRKLLLTDEFSAQPLRKDFVLASRVVKPWPGEKEPGEKGGTAQPAARQRRRMLPPGVPAPGTWGPPPPAAESAESTNTAEPAKTEGSS